MFRRPARLIIPEYSAPEGVSLIAAAELLGDGKRAIAAQVVDLAVRKLITISKDGGTAKKPIFTLRLNGSGDVGADEKDLLETIYGAALTPGTPFTTTPQNTRRVGAQLKNPHRRAIARLIVSGLAVEQNFFAKLVTFWRKQPVIPTAAAHPIVDHLWGIHDYVKLAEQDRLRVLQSPQGAEARIDPLTDLEILHLHERLLPYAVLFNLEKEWMKQLDLQYRELPPELLESIGTVIEVIGVVAQTLEVIEAVATLIEVTEVLDGVGAVFGGIGEVLGALSS